VGYQGRCERYADSVTRHSAGRADVSGLYLFTLNIRDKSTFVTAMKSTKAISQSGNYLFSNIQKEAMND
jgi:hypothetical protein